MCTPPEPIRMPNFPGRAGLARAPGSPQRRGWCAGRLALWLACLMAALLWAPASLASHRILDRAYVLDPTGQLTVEQARQQALSPFPSGIEQFDNGMDLTVVWIRVRLGPTPSSTHADGGPAGGPAVEKLRLVPLWNQELSVYDPLRLDGQGRLERIDIPSDPIPSTVHVVTIPAGEATRDIWIRFRPSGLTLLAVEVLSVEEAAARQVWDSSVESMAIGMLAVLLLVGAAAWWVDDTGIGRALFFKQLLNLAMAVQSASLLGAAGITTGLTLEVTDWEAGLMRVLNQVATLAFFIRVMELFGAARWALQAHRVLLALVAATALLPLAGEHGLFRQVGGLLHLGALIALFLSGFACDVEPAGSSRRPGRASRLARQFGLGLLLAMAWIGAFISGFFKTGEPSPLALIVSLPIVGAMGMLIVVGLRRIRQDTLRRRDEQRLAELRDQALAYERGERQRQQEFMVMLTHELKAPLSTMGMVLGAQVVTESMRRHAGLALSSMQQVIDHCAQSAEFEETEVPLNREACSLWVELELRHAALAERDRARVCLEPDPGLPVLQADRRMLVVIINNLLQNALKYAPPDSPVRLTAARETTGRGAVQVLSVINVPPEGPLPDTDRLFRKYYRGEATHRSSGSGLGLYLSRLLARRMGGDLVYQGMDRSVTFTLRLPE